MVWQYDDRRWRRVDIGFLILTSSLFFACVLSWRGIPVFGSEPPYRPLASVMLAGGLLLQAVAALFSRKRLYAISYSLLALSLVCFWFGVTSRSP
ncbi:MAG: hypothetical protein K2Y26_17460 [Gemmatimonadaceae bacterium]|nr:hypothetical protein [Gemmatimonadaceae bacterium]